MTKRWLMSLILGCLLLSLPAYAQTFEDGYQSYVRNQFPVAELQFKNALRKATVDEDKAVLLKYIGICQYMRGDKKNAQQSFAKALKSDSGITIESEDVLDPSVITFFSGIKARIGSELKKKQKAVQPPSVAFGSAPNPGKPQAQTQPQSSFSETAKPKTKKKKTAKAKGSESIMGLADSSIVVDDKSRKISFMQFLPFGLPQVHNDKYFLAGGVAALQIFTLYSMIDADKTIKDHRGLNAIVVSKEGLTDEQREAFYSKNNRFITKVKGQKNMALAGFVTIWGLSIAESFLFPKSSSRGTAGHSSPQQSLNPIVQANNQGGTFGLSWQAQLK
ncbi:MAG: hypothetical protein H7318_13030 [Oligoflexus sp.]|nr:hypothetical protein [Oligoflexus sp.]